MGAFLHRIFQRIREGYLKEMLTEARWMFQYVKKYKMKIMFYILLGLFSTGMGFASSILMKYLIDAVTSRQAPRLALMFACYVAFLLGSLFFNYLSGLLSARIRIRVENEIRSRMYREILETTWQAATAFHSGEFLNRLNGDVTTVSNCVLDWIPNLISRLTQAIGALCIILYYDPSMVFFALLGAPITLILSRFFMKKMRYFSKRSREVNGEVLSFNEESLQNMQTIKSFGLTGFYQMLMEKHQKNYENTMLDFNRFTLRNSLWMGLTNQAVTLACFGWCIFRLWTGFITFGTMSMFLGIASTLSTSFQSLLGLIPSAINATTSAGRLLEITALPKEEYPLQEEAQAFYDKNKTSGFTIQAKDITFSYGGDPVFSEGNFTILPGETIAFVGPSGEGKTTLLRIFLSLSLPSEGKIQLVGAEDESISLSPSTRRLFSYVPQGNTIFSGTIADNLRLGKENATEEEMVEVLKAACAYDFVKKLPKGLLSQIGEHGTGLSEGQSQRLAIARALLRDAPVYLLDEATSALDPATERTVLANLMQSKHKKTCIVTTHRPSVLSSCTKVYRISGGRICQLSPHEIQSLITQVDS